MSNPKQIFYIPLLFYYNKNETIDKAFKRLPLTIQYSLLSYSAKPYMIKFDTKNKITIEEFP